MPWLIDHRFVLIKSFEPLLISQQIFELSGLYALKASRSPSRYLIKSSYPAWYASLPFPYKGIEPIVTKLFVEVSIIVLAANFWKSS